MSRKLRMATLITVAVVAIWAVFSAGFVTGTVAGDQGFQPLAQLAGDAPPEPPADFDDVDFAVFWEAWTVIQKHFYGGPLDPEALREGAIRGMAEATEDRHTVYQNIEEAERSRERIRGSFVGVGIRIELRDGLPYIITPLPGSPAERAGIRANEFIVAVDGVPTPRSATCALRTSADVRPANCGRPWTSCGRKASRRWCSTCATIRAGCSTPASR